MYRIFKKNLSALLPRTFIVKNEVALRSFHGLFFWGRKHECTICKRSLRKFILLKTQDLLCPFCGSISRTRRLWKILDQDDHLEGDVLHFSPSRSLYRKLKKLEEINYISTDYEDEFLADHRYDITNIDAPDASFDLILCYHVLEHIENDKKAISELYRVLRTSGTIYVQTPFKEGDIYENDQVKTPQERLEHFGQEDHVRIYSVNGLKKLLEHAGFEVQVLHFENSDDTEFQGLCFSESILKLTK